MKRQPLAILALLLLAAPGVSAQTSATAEVDFSKFKGRQRSMLGAIHGATAVPDEPELTIPPYREIIDPLDFRVWSSGARMTTNGFVRMVHENHPQARAFLRLGAGLVRRCGYTGNSGRPYETPEAYRAYIRCAATWARDNGIDALDVWNEPNMSTFKGLPDGSKTRMELFFDTFKMAHETIREVWPNAVIAGPSLGKIDQDQWLQGFMDFCEREKLEVEILTWHEIGTLWNEKWFIDLPGKLKSARRKYINSGNYPNVGVKEIVINEYIASRYNDIPASNLAVMYYHRTGWRRRRRAHLLGRHPPHDLLQRHDQRPGDAAGRERRAAQTGDVVGAALLQQVAAQPGRLDVRHDESGRHGQLRPDPDGALRATRLHRRDRPLRARGKPSSSSTSSSCRWLDPGDGSTQGQSARDTARRRHSAAGSEGGCQAESKRGDQDRSRRFALGDRSPADGGALRLGARAQRRRCGEPTAGGAQEQQEGRQEQARQGRGGTGRRAVGGSP